MLLLLDRESFKIPTRARNERVDDSCYVHARAYTYMYTDECVYFCILTLLMSAHRYNVEKLAHWVDKEAPGWAKSKAFFSPSIFQNGKHDEDKTGTSHCLVCVCRHLAPKPRRYQRTFLVPPTTHQTSRGHQLFKR